MRNSDSFPRRLSFRLLRATAILFISAIFIVGLFSYVLIYRNAIKETSRMLENNLLQIQKVLSDVEVATNSSAWFVSGRSVSEESLLEFTSKLIEIDTNIISCAVDFDDLPQDSGKSYWTDPSFARDGSGKLVASYCKPISDEDGKVFAVLRCDVDLEWLSAKVQELKPYKNSYTILAGHNASIISHTNPELILNETLFSLAEGDEHADVRAIAERMVSGETGYGKYKSAHKRGFIVFGQLDNGWSGALVCTNDDVLAQAKKMNGISLLVAVLALIILYFSNKKIVEQESRPITAIAYSALSIAQGNFKARIPEVQSKDELRRLHDSLHYLEDSIGKYIHELRTTTSSKERYESELNIASAIQMQMLPRDYPNNEDVDLYAILHPAKEVGGDLYDFFVKDRMLYFSVGDVSGKGVPAALYMAITRSAFRFIAGLGLQVEGVVSRINNAFCDGNDSGMFVTMFVGRINLDTLELEYCNAGHNPILIISPDGSVNFLHAKANLAAGLFENFPYTGETLQIEKGSRLLIYTDGVTEAENRAQELYGEARLEDFARNEDMTKSSKQIADDLTADLKKFTKDNAQNDDITIMMIKL